MKNEAVIRNLIIIILLVAGSSQTPSWIELVKPELDSMLILKLIYAIYLHCYIG